MSEETNVEFPHGYVLSASRIFQKPAGDYEERSIYVGFRKDAGKWLAEYLDVTGDVLLFGAGDTPLEAFLNMAERYAILNGGDLGETFSYFMPFMLAHFNDDGSAKRVIDADFWYREKEDAFKC